VDLPNEIERQAIWSIQIEKHGRDPESFDIAQLARASDGFTGSEIEQAFIESLYSAFDEDSEPTDLTIATVLNESVPLSKLMAEQIAGLRTWAKGRARYATTVQPERKTRKLG
jgi:SpoVK/Ycf46/Vps4 family AAA+-type ATPase